MKWEAKKDAFLHILFAVLSYLILIFEHYHNVPEHTSFCAILDCDETKLDEFFEVMRRLGRHLPEVQIGMCFVFEDGIVPFGFMVATRACDFDLNYRLLESVAGPFACSFGRAHYRELIREHYQDLLRWPKWLLDIFWTRHCATPRFIYGTEAMELDYIHEVKHGVPKSTLRRATPQNIAFQFALCAPADNDVDRLLSFSRLRRVFVSRPFAERRLKRCTEANHKVRSTLLEELCSLSEDSSLGVKRVNEALKALKASESFQEPTSHRIKDDDGVVIRASLVVSLEPESSTLTPDVAKDLSMICSNPQCEARPTNRYKGVIIKGSSCRCEGGEAENPITKAKINRVGVYQMTEGAHVFGSWRFH